KGDHAITAPTKRLWIGGWMCRYHTLPRGASARALRSRTCHDLPSSTPETPRPWASSVTRAPTRATATTARPIHAAPHSRMASDTSAGAIRSGPWVGTVVGLGLAPLDEVVGHADAGEREHRRRQQGHRPDHPHQDERVRRGDGHRDSPGLPTLGAV